MARPPRLRCREAAPSGQNELKLVLTTTLGNYMLSLKENPTMVKWSNFKYKQVVNPCGLTWGPDLYRD